MLRDILSGARGMAPVVLTILIAWALLSVMFLTGTLLAARSIDRSVAVIKPNVDEIGTEAGFIDQARIIRDTAAKIDNATTHLSDHLGDTLVIAQSGIDPKLKRILGKVGQINSVADEINGKVLSIGATVDSIYASAHSINGTVHSIGRHGDSILGSVKEINSSARGILASGNSILSRVNSIDSAVATIVTDLATPIDKTAAPILEDFHGIDHRVGQTGRAGKFGQEAGPDNGNIVGHTNSIDCSTAFNTVTAPVLGALGTQLSNLLQPLLGKNGLGGGGCIK